MSLTRIGSYVKDCTIVLSDNLHVAKTLDNMIHQLVTSYSVSNYK